MNAEAKQDAAEGPLIITPSTVGQSTLEALAGWIRSKRELLAREKLSRGALVFREFALSTPDDFEVLLTAFGADLLPYDEGLSRREAVRPRIYPTTTYPPHLVICMHNELCHTWRPPRTLYLFCVVPPATDGQTPITDGREILHRLGPTVRNRFRNRRILYLSSLPSLDHQPRFGRAWQEVYGTDDRKEIERILERRSSRCEWQPDGALRTWSEGPVTVPHPDTGEDVWFNQLLLWHVTNLGPWGQKLRRILGEEGVPTNAFFDGGDPIGDKFVNDIRNLMWEERISFDWQTGDMAVVDNYRMLHGRNSFTGERLILLAMSAK